MSSPACSIRATSFPVSSCHDKFVVDTCSLSPIGISNVGAFRSESFNVVVVFYLQASGPQRIETAFSVVPFSGLGAFCASFSATKFTHARHFHIISAPRMETLNSTGELAAVSHSGLNIVPGPSTSNLYSHTVT